MRRRTLLAGLLGGLLSGSRRSGAAEQSILDLMEFHALPCVSLRSNVGTTVGKLGGQPDLDVRHAWPIWKGVPQSFLAQFDLAALQLSGCPDWLPKHGALFFFYDANQSTWGFSPDDRGSWSVVYDASGFAAAPRSVPETHHQARFNERSLGGRPSRSRPDAELLGVEAPEFDTREYQAYEARLYADLPMLAPWHQIGGYPAAIQSSDMALECQLAANGVNLGGSEGYASPRAKAIEAGAKDWRLLLQVDSDDEAGMIWGDDGRLYFWVREDEARRGDFTGVWMVLQCY